MTGRRTPGGPPSRRGDGLAWDEVDGVRRGRQVLPEQLQVTAQAVNPVERVLGLLAGLVDLDRVYLLCDDVEQLRRELAAAIEAERYLASPRPTG